MKMRYEKFDEAIECGNGRTIDNFVEIEIDEWYDLMESQEPGEHTLLRESTPHCLHYLGRPPSCECCVNPDAEFPF